MSFSNAAWLTFSGANTGPGSGAVNVVVAPNPGAQRSGTVSIAGQLFTVTQAASSSCAFTISPATRTSPATGESFAVAVSGGSCGWSATSSAIWLSVSPTAGTGNGSVNITVGVNTLQSPRTGSVAIAGQTLTVTQNAAACSYTVTPSSISAPSTGSSGLFTVVTTSTCTWPITGAPSWMTVSTATRTGNGGLSYTIAPNTGPQRSATVVVAGRSITVTQAASTSAAPIAPSNLRVVSPGGGN